MTDGISKKSEFLQTVYNSREELICAIDQLLKPGEHYNIYIDDKENDAVDIIYREKQLTGEMVDKSDDISDEDDFLLNYQNRVSFFDSEVDHEYKTTILITKESAWKESNGLYILNAYPPETRNIKSARSRLDQTTAN